MYIDLFDMTRRSIGRFTSTSTPRKFVVYDNGIYEMVAAEYWSHESIPCYLRRPNDVVAKQDQVYDLADRKLTSL